MDELTVSTSNTLPHSILSRVTSILVDYYDVSKEDVSPEKTWADMNLDSLDTVELIMEIEKEFNLSIPDDVQQGFLTLGDAVKYLEKHVISLVPQN